MIAANSINPIAPPPTSTCNSSKNTTAPNPQKASPRTLTELKIYSRLLEWEKHPILIFYEDAIAVIQGFSQTFLDALTRFKACRNLCIYA
ncbi:MULTISPECIES: NACHT C-terminal alpha/beta 1 domain-containing protein [unclassified Microcoleus]|uniref:NACHT C-terminal alpha/beta 1 domain-containing protein n=1 Tax=unclassified Microcoleus TaxID=2642155 RepID=UPI00403EF9BB